MRFEPFALNVGAALAVMLCFAGQVDAAPRKSPIRKPVAAAPTKPVEAAAEPAATEGPSDPAKTPSNFTEAFAEPSAIPSDAAEVSPPPADEAVPAASEAAPAPTEATAETTPVDASPPAADVPAASDEISALKKGDKPTREFMVGVWVEEGKSCAAALDFKADGTLIGPFPRWELEEGALTLVGSRQKIMLTVVDKNTMHSRRSDKDPPRTLKRCPA